MFTDHAACTSLLNTARPSGKLARWALAIQEMDLIIKHHSGKKNVNADALSRNPPVTVCAVDAALKSVCNEPGCVCCVRASTRTVCKVEPSPELVCDV